jgi:PKD repeat protein
MIKKYLFLILFLILAIFIVGCNGGEGTTPPVGPVIGNQSPTASFTADPTSGVAPLEVAFNASSSSDSDGTIVSYVWDFKDGNAGNGETINHTFSSIGSCNVLLTVTDDKGATGSTTKIVNVTETLNQSPTASFTANPTSGVIPLVVSFNASNSSDSDGTIILYTWNFGDGSNGSGVITSHIYENAGNYTVQLTVSDNDSASDSITMDIEVISGTIADGVISSNTTWTIANSPYIIINEDLQIAQDVTLSIEEGVVVKANPGRKIRVAGNLNTIGSESSPVKFTSLGSSKWGGIEFLDSPNSSINNTIIENAERAINLEGSSPVNFVGNVFRYNEWAVTDNGGYQNMHFLNNTFLNNEEVFYGIRTSGDVNRFENNIFIDNNNVFSHGFFFGQTLITNNNFLNNNFIIRAPEIGYGYGTVDMLNNWWGTTDTSIIDSYIEDGNDDVSLQTLNYNPIKNSEISNIGSPISGE